MFIQKWTAVGLPESLLVSELVVLKRTISGERKRERERRERKGWSGRVKLIRF